MKPKNPYESFTPKNHAWNNGYAAGLADGARRERQAVMRRVVQEFNKLDKMGVFSGAYANLRSWLTARSRRGK